VHLASELARMCAVRRPSYARLHHGSGCVRADTSWTTCGLACLNRPQPRSELAVVQASQPLMIGTPGTGKTMLAPGSPSLLASAAEREKRWDIATIASVSGGVHTERGLERPFRAPHHFTRASDAALIGVAIHSFPVGPLAQLAACVSRRAAGVSAQASKRCGRPWNRRSAVSRAARSSCAHASTAFDQSRR